MPTILDKLSGGDMRSIGRVDEVVEQVLADDGLFAELFAGISHPDPRIRMRAADAVEKITIQRPDLLQPYKTILLEDIAGIPQQEVRWHVAQLLPRLTLNSAEREHAVGILKSYLDDKSKIVVTFSMQALVDLVAQDEKLRHEILPIVVKLTQTGSPAVESRGKKLLHQLQA